MKSYDLVINEYKTDPLYRNISLGQYFVLCYIRTYWSELYFADDVLAKCLIKSWLKGAQYYDKLPPKVKKDHSIKIEFLE